MTILARIGAIRVKRRTMYLILVACAVLGSYGIAHASPTPAQVRRAVDPAFTARHLSLGVLAIAAVADVLTTEQGLHRGCVEGNGLYGSHPSLPLMIGTHAFVVGTAVYGRTPAWANYTAAALFGFAAIHNTQVQCVRR